MNRIRYERCHTCWSIHQLANPSHSCGPKEIGFILDLQGQLSFVPFDRQLVSKAVSAVDDVVSQQLVQAMARRGKADVSSLDGAQLEDIVPASFRLQWPIEEQQCMQTLDELRNQLSIDAKEHKMAIRQTTRDAEDRFIAKMSKHKQKLQSLIRRPQNNMQ